METKEVKEAKEEKVVEIKDSKIKAFWKKHKSKVFGFAAGSLSAVVAYAIGNNQGLSRGFLLGLSEQSLTKDVEDALEDALEEEITEPETV